MFSKRKFTVSIGEYGVIVALHDGKNVQNKILVAALNDENKSQLKDLFLKNKSVPTHILLDTPDQSYKKKSYPLVNQFDFRNIVKRDLKKETNNKIKFFQNYYGFKDKVHKKWDCTFIYTISTPEVEEWIEFLLTLPNHLVGVYMLPIEANSLANSVFDLIKVEHNLKTNPNTLISFVIQNKISGVRQVVFDNKSIIFTRVVNYDFDDQKFAVNFEQDIFRSNEYLKMVLPNLKLQDLVIVNILSDDIIKKIEHIKNKELLLFNYSPSTIAEKLSITNATSRAGNGNFSDILIANHFSQNKKKILKFANAQISTLNRFYAAIKSLFFVNVSILLIASLILISLLIGKYKSNNQLFKLNRDKLLLEQELQSINKAALEGEDANQDAKLANDIIDFGKIDEVLSKSEIDVMTTFGKMVVFRKHGSSMSSFSYSVSGYDPKSTSFTANKISYTIGGEISDPSGDVEVLFRKFDSLTFDTKNIFLGYDVKYSEISKSVDFSKKYYSLPFDLSISNK